MASQCCENCYWRRVALSQGKTWKCRLNPKKRFDKPKLNGWFCKKFLDNGKETNYGHMDR